MNPGSINQRIEDIKGNDEELNRLVEEYKPFVAACVEKATGKYVRYGKDDELSIGLMAFVEAIHSHDSAKGNFLSFAQTVIKRRLIDYYRKEKKYQNVVSLHAYQTDDGEEEKDLSTHEAIAHFQSGEISEYRKLEIEEIEKELKKWEISFGELVQVSPKQNKVRSMCREILDELLSKPALLAIMKEKKYLPIAEIEKSLRIPRKKIERSRKYIIALVIIFTGDYPYIQSFIKLEDQGGAQP